MPFPAAQGDQLVQPGFLLSDSVRALHFLEPVPVVEKTGHTQPSLLFADS